MKFIGKLSNIDMISRPNTMEFINVRGAEGLLLSSNNNKRCTCTIRFGCIEKDAPLCVGKEYNFIISDDYPKLLDGIIVGEEFTLLHAKLSDVDESLVEYTFTDSDYSVVLTVPEDLVSFKLHDRVCFCLEVPQETNA